MIALVTEITTTTSTKLQRRLVLLPVQFVSAEQLAKLSTVPRKNTQLVLEYIHVIDSVSGKRVDGPLFYTNFRESPNDLQIQIPVAAFSRTEVILSAYMAIICWKNRPQMASASAVPEPSGEDLVAAPGEPDQVTPDQEADQN
jgi:hypothetical protein